MLPEEAWKCLGACGYQSGEETLAVLAKPSEKSDFGKLAGVIRVAVSNDATM
jgi:hypothetical protein